MMIGVPTGIRAHPSGPGHFDISTPMAGRTLGRNDGVDTSASQGIELEVTRHVQDEDGRAAGYNELPEHERGITDEELDDGPLTAEEESVLAKVHERELGDYDIPFDADDPRWSHDGPEFDDSRDDAARAADSGEAEGLEASRPDTNAPRPGDDEPGDAARARSESEEGLSLKGETHDEATARTEAALEEEGKAQADEDAKDFKLTGSDRPADANPDQPDLVSRQGAPALLPSSTARARRTTSAPSTPSKSKRCATWASPSASP
ncbi:hypothetical protein LMG27952_04762 [Paraburkholderia hiiakae]|uniref:DUF5709 domain-containing protein n=2 Tax=Paraburkholderia hiiakae TaxID=1081782 RepID=A0ABN7I3S9_9BURK|nr:hypothetical protein LMG27952_04762 [Paraburkholderia hiiakae]